MNFFNISLHIKEIIWCEKMVQKSTDLVPIKLRKITDLLVSTVFNTRISCYPESKNSILCNIFLEGIIINRIVYDKVL